MNDTLSTTLSNGITVINHDAYQASLKTKTNAELRWIIKDATEAMNAMPDGHKAGYYADEVSYCAMEITLRQTEHVPSLVQQGMK